MDALRYIGIRLPDTGDLPSTFIHIFIFHKLLVFLNSDF